MPNQIYISNEVRSNNIDRLYSSKTSIYIARKLAIISIFSLPLNHAFALGQFVTISLISSIISALFCLISDVKINWRLFIVTGFIPLMLIVTGLFSYFLNGFGSNADSIEVTRALLTNLLLFVYAFCLVVMYNLLSLRIILKWVMIGIVCSSVYGLADVFLANFSSFQLDNYIPRYSATENGGSIGYFIRLRSTFAESGTFSFYLNLLAPWALIYFSRYYNSRSKIFPKIIVIAISCAFLLAFSTAGFFIFCVITFVLAFRERKFTYLTPLAIVLILASTVKTVDDNEIIFLLLSKFNGQQQDSSRDDRFNRLDFASEKLKGEFDDIDIKTLIFGSGPGWAASNFGGIVNTYLYFAIEYGFLSLFLLFGFYLFVWWRILRHRGPLIFYSFSSFVINIIFIQDYFYLFAVFAFYLLAIVYCENILRVSRSRMTTLSV
jgi:O-antigen ligase